MRRAAIGLLMCLATSRIAAAQGSPPFLSTDWLARAVIYEVNIRQATPAGTFDAFRTQHLARLDSLGVKILWLMPISPIGIVGRKGRLGSYYAVRDYTSVNPEYGTLADLRQLVDAAHGRGMAVILDWVANHTSPDHPWVTAHPDWYTHDSTGKIVPPVADWHDTADLNYDVPALRAEMLRSMEFWLTEAGIDGYRCDVAEMVPMDFWKTVKPRLEATKPVVMLAEGESAQLHQAFDMTYSWTFHHLMNRLAQGKANAAEVASYWRDQEATYRASDVRMQFITNHDENSWNGTEHERLGESRLAAAVLSFAVKGIPLIYTGQEADMNKRLRFFDKDTVAWSRFVNASFYRTLTRLKRGERALDADGGAPRFLATGNDRVVAFVREKGTSQVVTVANFSSEPVIVSVTDSSLRGRYASAFGGREVGARGAMRVRLPPNGFVLKVRRQSTTPDG